VCFLATSDYRLHQFFDFLSPRIYNFGMQALFKRVVGLFLDNKYLALIFVLAALLRLLYLTYAPPSLNWDEVSHGYNAYSILKTGKDEWGSLPFSNFRAYGDYPLALNLYLTIPFIAVFGLNEFSVRLPHALLGTFTVVAAYFLALGITKSKKVSLITALLVAVEPWSLFLSRFVVQSNLSVFFLTASLAAFFNREKNRYLFPLSIFFLGLTLFSYHTTRLVSPILLVLGFFIYKKSTLSVLAKDKRVKILTIALVLAFFLPLPFVLSRPEARARSGFTFIINQGAVSEIIEARAKSNLPDTVKRLLYNRPTYFVGRFAANYINYFSPKFLFVKGGTQYQFSVPEKGLLYLISLPFFYLGLLLVVKKAFKGEVDFRFMLTWLIVSPIPAAITSEPNAVVRATAMIPAPMIISALGLVSASGWLKDKLKVSPMLLYLGFVGALALFIENYLNVYITSYRSHYSWSWQWGYRQVVQYAKNNYQKYDKIVVTKKYGEPHEFFLFFWPWDPLSYRNDPNLIRYYQSEWFWVDGFDKFYFVNDWDIPKDKDTLILESKKLVDCSEGVKCLLITSPGNYPAGWRSLETVKFLDGKGAFEIYEN